MSNTISQRFTIVFAALASVLALVFVLSTDVIAEETSDTLQIEVSENMYAFISTRAKFMMMVCQPMVAHS